MRKNSSNVAAFNNMYYALHKNNRTGKRKAKVLVKSLIEVCRK